MAYALLIDDDPDILRSAVEAVERSGLSLITASSWEEGIRKFHGYSPELVISDYNLPGSEMGLSLLVEVARLRPSAKLFLISGYLNEADADEVLALGLVDGVMSKNNPVETARLIVREVREAASRSEAPTNWAEFGQATGEKRSIDADALSKLDAFLKMNRLPGGAS